MNPDRIRNDALENIRFVLEDSAGSNLKAHILASNHHGAPGDLNGIAGYTDAKVADDAREGPRTGIEFGLPNPRDTIRATGKAYSTRRNRADVVCIGNSRCRRRQSRTQYTCIRYRIKRITRNLRRTLGHTVRAGKNYGLIAEHQALDVPDQVGSVAAYRESSIVGDGNETVSIEVHDVASGDRGVEGRQGIALDGVVLEVARENRAIGIGVVCIVVTDHTRNAELTGANESRSDGRHDLVHSGNQDSDVGSDQGAFSGIEGSLRSRDI